MRAEGCYKELRHSPRKQEYRDNWLFCIKKFQAVYQHDPSGPWAAAGLYMSGLLYRELSKRSFRKSDIKEASDIFERIIKRFPRSRYRPRAQIALRKLSENKMGKRPSGKARHSSDKRKARMTPKRTASLKSLSSAAASVQTTNGPALRKSVTVEGLRFWSNPSYTRVVIDADRETSYIHRLLKKDPSINKPQRLYVDLKNSRIGKHVQRIVPINDNLLSDARAGQHTGDSVRVVVDIKSFKTYKIFSLKNPFRIVVDVWGSAAQKTHTARLTPKTARNDKKIKGALAKQLALGVRRVVIDPGHGGRDFGAPGFLKGVHEKDVALKIARRLAAKIRKKLNCEVVLTRTRDQYLTLEERTAMANTKNADLFISIHTNANRHRSAFGIETYFLNLATDDEAIMVAARENATSTKNISDLQTILNDLMQNAKINESSRLAGFIQGSLCNYMKKRYRRIKNKGVKQAPFYVLLGAQMPAILIETSFISNSRECKRLVDTTYQDHLCNAIVRGIRDYIVETNPTAFLRTSPKNGFKG